MSAGFIAVRLAMDTLGVNGFGTYAAVASVAGFLGFFSGALGESCRKYFSEAMGGGRDLRRTFAFAFAVATAGALAVAVAGEVVGLILVKTAFNLSGDSAVTAYHLVVAAAALSVLRVPFEAAVVASERMRAFLFAGLLEAVVVLAAACLPQVLARDLRLPAYAGVLAVGEGALLVFFVGCGRRVLGSVPFPRLTDAVDGLMRFFGWCSVRSLSTDVKYRGTEMLINVFSGAAFNSTWRAAMRLGSLLYMVVGSFQLAFTPRLMKLRAAGDGRGFFRLLLAAEAVSFGLLTAVAVPVAVWAPEVVRLWLGASAPPQIVAFIRVFAVHFVFDALNGPLHAAITTAADSSRYQLVVSLVMGSGFLFALGALAAGLPAWSAPAGVALANVLSFGYRLAVLRPYTRFDIISPHV